MGIMTELEEKSVFRLQSEQVRRCLGKRADPGRFGELQSWCLGNILLPLFPDDFRDRVIEQ